MIAVVEAHGSAQAVEGALVGQSGGSPRCWFMWGDGLVKGALENPFDRGAAEAAEYDSWYDSAAGRAVLRAEQRCIGELIEGATHPRLDLGTGSGRFGGHLGAEVGLDPAFDLLRIASRRMPSVVRGVAEALPFRDATLGAVLSVAAFEFLRAPADAIHEITRVLRPGGRFVLGFFPRESAWARAYLEDGRDPRSVFHSARFFSVEDVEALAGGSGLHPGDARSALFEAPGSQLTERVVNGVDSEAGFVAIALMKAAR